MQYRRAATPGAAYFFTVVAYNRQQLFKTPDTVQLLRKAFLTPSNNAIPLLSTPSSSYPTISIVYGRYLLMTPTFPLAGD